MSKDVVPLIELYEQLNNAYQEMFETIKIESEKAIEEGSIGSIESLQEKQKSFIKQIESINSKIKNEQEKLGINENTKPDDLINFVSSPKTEELKSKIGQKRDLIKKIADINDCIRDVLQQKYDHEKHNIKKLQKGRRANRLYNAKGKQHEGIFIDHK